MSILISPYNNLFPLNQVRVELVRSPEDYIAPMLERVKPEYIKKTYKIDSWTDSENFLEQIAKKSGKLLKVMFIIIDRFLCTRQKNPTGRVVLDFPVWYLLPVHWF